MFNPCSQLVIAIVWFAFLKYFKTRNVWNSLQSSSGVIKKTSYTRIYVIETIWVSWSIYIFFIFFHIFKLLIFILNLVFVNDVKILSDQEKKVSKDVLSEPEKYLRYLIKCQLISKGLFVLLNSTKKRTKNIDFTTMIPQVDLFSFGFWKKLKTTKRYFEINWPLAILFMRIFIKHLVKRNHRNSKAAIVLCKNKKKPGQIFMLYFVIRKGRNSYLEY